MAVLTLVALAVIAVTLSLRHDGVFAAIERQTIDSRFALRGSRRPPKNIVVVGLNTASLAALPRFPFSRVYDARMLDQLHRAGARVIFYDFEFDRPTTTSADDALFEAAARSAPVVFAAARITTDGHTDVFGGNANVRSIGDQVAASLLPDDPDGAVRHLAGEVNQLPSVASVVQRLVAGRATSPRAIANTGAWIDYYGPPDTFPTISFDKVLAGQFDRRLVRGHIVLVGATAPDIEDHYPTSAGGEMAGVEIQANAIATLLAGLPLRNAASWLQTLLIALAVAGICAVAIRGRGWMVGVVGLTALSAWSIATVVLFDHGRIVEFTPETFAIVLATGGALAVAAMEDARERRELRQLFAAGSPDLVSQVLSGESRLRGWASQIIDGYTIQEVISRGGMGAVYRATQRGLGREVAVKVILPEFAQSAEHRARFELECRAAAAIEHPNVIPVYDTGDYDAVLYIAMRLVSGGSLEDELHGALDPVRATRIIEQLALALDAAHARGIVHRDVKPSNVLLTGDEPEHVYLTDFGIAKWLGESGQLTRADGWIGTATYASPEQLRGAELDGRADVYSLAAVLYHCLTGEPPYPRESKASVVLAHLNDPAPTPTAINEALPAEIDAVIAKGLAKDPGERFATATDFARAVAAALGVNPSLPAPSAGVAASAPADAAEQGAPVSSSEETELA